MKFEFRLYGKYERIFISRKLIKRSDIANIKREKVQRDIRKCEIY